MLNRTQAATAVAVLAALSVGSVVNEHLQGPQGVLKQPYERTTTVGQPVSLRTMDLTVERISTAAKLLQYRQTATTTGTWLLVDLSHTPTHRSGSPVHGTIVATDGRRFGGRQAVSLSCEPVHPGTIGRCRQIFELPKGVLAGAVLEIPAAGGRQGDDVAVVDLGLDQGRAADLEASTATVDLGKEE